jgi:peptidoglycan/xylan/chitin deacetylase (PgdA/CDA1 family)
MNGPPPNIWQRGAEWLQKRFTSRALILMYHQVAEVDLDPWSLCVTPQHFAEHLEIVQKYARPIGLQQLARSHRDGSIPHRAVVLTFDDGYANNLHNAKPLLERYNISATVFVTTGQVGQNREFWWDELEGMLLKQGKLPEKLSLKINDRLHQWELGAAANYSQEEYRSDRDRKAWEGLPGSRLAFYYSVWEQLRPIPANERQQLQDEIAAWAGAEPTPRPSYRPLITEEVRTLAQGGLIEIGAHTVTHPFLSAHSVMFQRNEIQKSKADLEALLDYPVNSFAYPFGDYTAETVPLIPEAGFNCACSTVQHTVWRNSDYFQFPRFAVENWSGKEFQKRLFKWLYSG